MHNQRPQPLHTPLPTRHVRLGAVTATVATALVAALLTAAPASASPVQTTTATTLRWAERGTGFSFPFSGTPWYESQAPTELANPGQLNQPLGQQAADRIAQRLGLNEADAFTQKQYLEFISGQGNGGQPDQAKIAAESMKILTNTVGRPLYSTVDGQITPTTLASYGLFVNPDGMLESPANSDAAPRKINLLLVPVTGYLATWCRANGAMKTMAAIYRSPYVLEATYGYLAQQESGTAQLVANTKNGVTATVGMSMAPALWLVNFILIYYLNPSLAATMPAYWAPIPAPVANAIQASTTGQVPYSQYASYLQ